MTLSLKIEKEFAQNSERVKSVDLHPTQPWILASLYSGTVSIWNYQSNAIEKSFKLTDSPVRSAKFINGKNWVVGGSDDGYIRVYDYKTSEKVTELKAHEDFIRSVVVHPNLPYVISASDDKTIKLWDWQNSWTCVRTFEGHSHYVMQVSINPNDSDTFVSASLDGTIMLWSIESTGPRFTLDGHSKGVNCVDFSVVSDKTYIFSGSDDFATKMWDNETKSCVKTLEGHLNNVTSVCVHPELPIVISGSEDSTVRIWNANTYKLEKTLDYELGRVWAIGYIKGSNSVVFGCDNGIVMVKITNYQA